MRDRKSTSGGVWMLGSHCIKTLSASQGAYVLSGVEAELYAMERSWEDEAFGNKRPMVAKGGSGWEVSSVQDPTGREPC
eukprot:7263933-Karenia_brevis.AAC.2